MENRVLRNLTVGLCSLGVLISADVFAQQTSRPSSRSNPSSQSTRTKSTKSNRQNKNKVQNSDSSTASGVQEGTPQAEPMPQVPNEPVTPADIVQPSIGSGSVQSNRKEEATEAHITGRKNARTITLAVPAARGQIVDRNALPLAQNVVAYQLALEFGQFTNEDRDHVVAYGRRMIKEAKKFNEGRVWEISDEQLWQHYRHRRWLPLPLTNVIYEQEKKNLISKLPKGLKLHPIYIRFYPEKSLVSHMVGYVGSKGKLPTGPINYMDPLWEFSEGRSGFEKEFNQYLTGQPGVWKLLFDEDGNNLLNELSSKPKPGGTIVTTINLKWQKKAAEVMAKLCKRGAMVVIDIETGEILVMVSQPSYDPNLFVPNISADVYRNLLRDPNNPLVSRAYKGVYPPASTFKSIVALAALNDRAIKPNETVYCPASITIGNHTFNNWSKSPEGSINVMRALARSCNPWFYQVGIKIGPNSFLSMARKLGMGERTGLPIEDVSGLVPTEEWMRRVNRRGFYDGDTANLSIGQGVLLVTPLQVAQAMAGIGNGKDLPQLQLIRQIQDINGNVIYAPTPQSKRTLNISDEAIDTVHEGMRQVVNGPNGTGGRAKLSYTELCGKTGTAQWGPKNENKRLAWFAGYFPADHPKYAFAVLYEGVPNERVGGGANAAPIVKQFFESVKSDVLPIIKPPKAITVEEDPEENPTPPAEETPPPPHATPVAPNPPPSPALNPLPPRAIPVDESEDEEPQTQSTPNQENQISPNPSKNQDSNSPSEEETDSQTPQNSEPPRAIPVEEVEEEISSEETPKLPTKTPARQTQPQRPKPQKPNTQQPAPLRERNGFRPL